MNQITKIQNMFIATLAGTAFITTFSFISVEPNRTFEVKPIVVSTMDEVQSKDARPYKVVYVDSKPTESWWSTLINIESNGNANRYRPTNKQRNCKQRKEACGAHQLTLIALKDIGCKPLNKCLADRNNYKLSQHMANKYNKRLTELGCKFKSWQRYICWNMGAGGALKIFEASASNLKLSKTILKNMANNSPFKYSTLRRWGSKKSANKFLEYRKKVWFNKLVKI